ncbi:MAG: hypothetical protein Q9196_004534 [Gyalolechia fulgens]
MHQQSYDKRDGAAQALGYSSHAERMAHYWDRALEHVRRDDEHARLTNTTTAEHTIDQRLLQEMQKDEDRKAQAKGYSSHAERMKKRQEKDDDRFRQRHHAFVDRIQNPMDQDTIDQQHAEARRLVQEIEDKWDRQAQAAGYASYAEEMKAWDDQMDERTRQDEDRIRQEDERLRKDPALLEAKRECFITAASVAEPVSSQSSFELTCNCEGGQSNLLLP